ncbi:hypothetical protein pb186bvf_008088 [Paramecium bursaria]
MKILNVGDPVNRYHEIYQGNVKWLLNGKIILGFTPLPIIISFTCLNAGMALYYTRIQQQGISLILTILFHVLSVLMMVLTGFSDPGIIPRIQQNYHKHVEQYLIPHSHKFEDQFVVQSQHKTFDLKYCETCSIFKPPQTAHCRRCDNCVQQFDHHCLWLGTCIGRRNYKKFYLFIWCISINLILVDLQIIQNIVSKDKIIEMSFYLALDTGFLIFTSYLVTLHTYLICNNLTTYDYLTTDYFVNQYYDEILHFEDGKLLSRRLERLKYNIKQRFTYGLRAMFIKFSTYIYTEIPLEIKRIQITQRQEFDKIKQKQKNRFFESETSNSKSESHMSLNEQRLSTPIIIHQDEQHQQQKNNATIKEVTENNDSKLEELHIYSPQKKQDNLKLSLSQSQLLVLEDESKAKQYYSVKIRGDQNQNQKQNQSQQNDVFTFNEEIQRLQILD